MIFTGTRETHVSKFTPSVPHKTPKYIMYDRERGGVTEARAAKIFRSGAQDNYYEQAQRSIIGSKRNVKPTAPRMCNAACTKLKY